MLGLNILKWMWFTDYRASKYEYESVYELYSEYNEHECEGVWVIIKYEMFRHDTIMLSCF